MQELLRSRFPEAHEADVSGLAEKLRNPLTYPFRGILPVVALGLDTARGDPTGTWSLRPDDVEANGAAIGSLGLPTLVVQEGGYGTRVLGRNARSFFTGLWNGAHGRDRARSGRSRHPSQRSV